MMTPDQLKLARHALGLPNRLHRAYRNRFAGARRSRDYMEWRRMVDAGYALRWPWHYAYGDHFMLTSAGASTAMRGRERLDPEEVAAIRAIERTR